MLPMQKSTTLSNKTDVISENKNNQKLKNFQPQDATIEKILEFSSVYRVQKIADNQFIEIFLN